MNGLYRLMVVGLVAVLGVAGAVPLPSPPRILGADSYEVGTVQGKAYSLDLTGSFNGAQVQLCYYDEGSSSLLPVAAWTGPVQGYVHAAKGNKATLVVTGGTSPSISVKLVACDPIVPTGTQLWNADGSAGLAVQEKDLLRTDSAATAAAGGVYVQDCAGLRSMTVVVTAAGTGGTLIGEFSNDNATWSAATGYAAANPGTAGSFTTAQALSLGAAYQYPTPGRYFRLRLTGITSGSYTFQSYFRSESIPKLSVFVGNAAGTTSVSVQGAGAAGNPAVGFPVRNGAVTRTVNGTPRTDAQLTDLTSTAGGALVVKPFAVPETDWSYAAPAGGLANSAAAAVVKAASGAGIRNYVTSLNISADALGSACDLVVLDGATPVYRQRLQTAGLPGGLTVDFPSPLRTAANAALSIQTLVGGTATAVTGGIYVNAQGYAGP